MLPKATTVVRIYLFQVGISGISLKSDPNKHKCMIVAKINIPIPAQNNKYVLGTSIDFLALTFTKAAEMATNNVISIPI